MIEWDVEIGQCPDGQSIEGVGQDGMADLEVQIAQRQVEIAACEMDGFIHCGRFDPKGSTSLETKDQQQHGTRQVPKKSLTSEKPIVCRIIPEDHSG